MNMFHLPPAGPVWDSFLEGYYTSAPAAASLQPARPAATISAGCAR